MFEQNSICLYSTITQNDEGDDFGIDILENIFDNSNIDQLCRYYKPEELLRVRKNTDNNLLILHVNGRSILKKLRQF